MKSRGSLAHIVLHYGCRIVIAGAIRVASVAAGLICASTIRKSKDIFEYVTGPSGVASISVRHPGWGTRFVADGWKDLIVGQGR